MSERQELRQTLDEVNRAIAELSYPAGNDEGRFISIRHWQQARDAIRARLAELEKGNK
jgi:hypothetical protein